MSTDLIIEGEAREIPAPTNHAQAGVMTLFGSDDPSLVVEKAQGAAKALVAVVEKQGLYATINRKRFPLVEAWTLLGSMLGVFPVTVWSRPVASPDGKTTVGWEARVEARTLGGQTVGAAEAMCTRAESKWRDSDEYAIRSMAQTRAVSKSLSMPLRFVMQLAGFEGTPAEEMPADGGQRQSNAPPARSNGAAPKRAPLRDCPICAAENIPSNSGKVAAIWPPKTEGKPPTCNGVIKDADGTRWLNHTLAQAEAFDSRQADPGEPA